MLCLANATFWDAYSNQTRKRSTLHCQDMFQKDLGYYTYVSHHDGSILWYPSDDLPAVTCHPPPFNRLLKPNSKLSSTSDSLKYKKNGPLSKRVNRSLNLPNPLWNPDNNSEWAAYLGSQLRGPEWPPAVGCRRAKLGSGTTYYHSPSLTFCTRKEFKTILLLFSLLKLLSNDSSKFCSYNEVFYRHLLTSSWPSKNDDICKHGILSGRGRRGRRHHTPHDSIIETKDTIFDD